MDQLAFDKRNTQNPEAELSLTFLNFTFVSKKHEAASLPPHQHRHTLQMSATAVEVPSASLSPQTIHMMLPSSSVSSPSAGSSSDDPLPLEDIISSAMDDAEFTMKMQNFESERKCKRKTNIDTDSIGILKSTKPRIRFHRHCRYQECHEWDQRLFLEIELSSLVTANHLCAYFRLFPVYKHNLSDPNPNSNSQSNSVTLSPCSNLSPISSPSLAAASKHSSITTNDSIALDTNSRFGTSSTSDSRIRSGSQCRNGCNHDSLERVDCNRHRMKAMNIDNSIDDETLYDEIITLKLCDFIFRQQLNGGFFLCDFGKPDFLEMMGLVTRDIDIGDYDYYWIWHLLSYSISMAKPRESAACFGWIDSWTRYQHKHSEHHWRRCCRSISTEVLESERICHFNSTHSIHYNQHCHAVNRIILGLYLYQNIKDGMDRDIDCIELRHRLSQCPFGDLSALHRDYQHIMTRHNLHDEDITRKTRRFVQCNESTCTSMRRRESESMVQFIETMRCSINENVDDSKEDNNAVCYELMDLLHCCFVHRWPFPHQIRRGNECQNLSQRVANDENKIPNIMHSQSVRRDEPPKALSRALARGSRSYSQHTEGSERSVASKWSFVSRSGRRKSNTITHMKYRIYF